MLNGLIIYGVFSIIISASAFFAAAIGEKSLYMYCCCPKYIYDNSDLNVFGVIIVFLLLFALMPLYYVLWFGYWLIHVGRKKNHE